MIEDAGGDSSTEKEEKEAPTILRRPFHHLQEGEHEASSILNIDLSLEECAEAVASARKSISTSMMHEEGVKKENEAISTSIRRLHSKSGCLLDQE